MDNDIKRMCVRSDGTLLQYSNSSRCFVFATSFSTKSICLRSRSSVSRHKYAGMSLGGVSTTSEQGDNRNVLQKHVEYIATISRAKAHAATSSMIYCAVIDKRGSKCSWLC